MPRVKRPAFFAAFVSVCLSLCAPFAILGHRTPIGLCLLSGAYFIDAKLDIFMSLARGLPIKNFKVWLEDFIFAT